MERAPRVAVVPASFDWSDIGSWKAMSDLEAEADSAGNRVRGKAIVIESERCYIQSDTRIVAAVGVKDLVIVDTGDAVLVADRERAQQVKLVVEQLRAENHDAAAFHKTVHRPWGSFTVLEDAADCKVKRLVVKPGHVLSLQPPSPAQRALDRGGRHREGAHWRKEMLLERNESAYIPNEHRTPARESDRSRRTPDRSAVRRLFRRGRHRAARRSLRPRAYESLRRRCIYSVIPAKAGIHLPFCVKSKMGPGLRRDDGV